MPDRNIGVGRNCIQSKGLEVVVFYIGDRIRQMHQVAVRACLLFVILSGKINNELHKPGNKHGLVSLLLAVIFVDHDGNDR